MSKHSMRDGSNTACRRSRPFGVGLLFAQMILIRRPARHRAQWSCSLPNFRQCRDTPCCDAICGETAIKISWFPSRAHRKVVQPTDEILGTCPLPQARKNNLGEKPSDSPLGRRSGTRGHSTSITGPCRRVDSGSWASIRSATSC